MKANPAHDASKAMRGPPNAGNSKTPLLRHDLPRSVRTPERSSPRYRARLDRRFPSRRNAGAIVPSDSNRPSARRRSAAPLPDDEASGAADHLFCHISRSRCRGARDSQQARSALPLAPAQQVPVRWTTRSRARGAPGFQDFDRRVIHRCWNERVSSSDTARNLARHSRSASGVKGVTLRPFAFTQHGCSPPGVARRIS